MRKLVVAIILFLSCFSVEAQFKYLQTGNYILRFDTTTTRMMSERNGDEITTDILNIGTQTLYVRTYYESIYYFNASLEVGDVAQVGTTGLWLLTCPTTVTATKGILIGSSYLEYSTATHSVEQGPYNTYSIIRTSDSALVCTIYPLKNNSIIWYIAPSTITTPFSTSGIKKIIVP